MFSLVVHSDLDYLKMVTEILRGYLEHKLLNALYLIGKGKIYELEQKKSGAKKCYQEALKIYLDQDNEKYVLKTLPLIESLIRQREKKEREQKI